MITLRWALLVTILVCVVASIVTGIANGVLLLAGVLLLVLAWTLRDGPSQPCGGCGDADCDCPVDHSEALLDERTD